MKHSQSSERELRKMIAARRAKCAKWTAEVLKVVVGDIAKHFIDKYLK